LTNATYNKIEKAKVEQEWLTVLLQCYCCDLYPNTRWLLLYQRPRRFTV